MLMGEHSGYGFFGNSVSLAGGHGTTIIWGGVGESAGLQAAKEIGVAFAMLGLVAVGIPSVSIAEKLIGKYHIKGNAVTGEADHHEEIRVYPVVDHHVFASLSTMLILALFFEAGKFVIFF